MRLAHIFLLTVLLLATGGSTPYLDHLNRIYWERQRGQITEEEYQNKLQQMKDEQPWGGAKRNPPGPFLWTR